MQLNYYFPLVFNPQSEWILTPAITPPVRETPTN
jgi:hypothetical protein